MDIAVIGAGNMGCLYGANLARAGAAVTLVDTWAEHIEAIKQKGLRIEGLNGSFVASVRAAVDPAAVGKVDIALILVNAYGTEAAAQTAKKILKDSGYALSLQNGLGNLEILVDSLGEGRVLGGLSFHSADLSGPGQVRHTNRGPTYLGEMDRAQTRRVARLNDLMEAAQLQPVLEPDIMATIWGKFVHNCAINALCAITDLRPGHLRDIAALDEFQHRIIQETLALVAAKGIILPNQSPQEEIKAYCAKKFHRVSMLQHLSRGRQTEIDALNGYVVRESKRLGLACPYNESLTALVKGLQYLPVGEAKHDPD